MARVVLWSNGNRSRLAESNEPAVGRWYQSEKAAKSVLTPVASRPVFAVIYTVAETKRLSPTHNLCLRSASLQLA